MPRQDKRLNRTMMRGQGARASVDTGSGSPRVAQGRAEHMKRGKFVNFYEDLGISATPGQAKGIREEEAKFQSDVKKQKGRIAEAQSSYSSSQSRYKSAQERLAEAKGSTPSVKEANKEAYGNVVSSWDTVKVVESHLYNNTLGPFEGDTKKDIRGITGADESGVIKTYKMPSQWSEQVLSSKGIGSKRDEDGNLIVYTSARIAGDGGPVRYDHLLKNAVDEAAAETERKLKEAVGEEVESALLERSSALQGEEENLRSAKAQLDRYGNQISSAKSKLSATEAKRARQWEKLHSDYENKLETMRKIFEGLEVKGGEKKTTEG